MKAIRSYDNYIQANMQLTLLQDAGLDCYIQDEYTITIDPLLSPALGGMKLMVKENDIDEANRILETTERTFLENVVCENCGQKSIQKIVNVKTFDTVWQQLWSVLKNGQPVEQTTVYRCYSCGAIQEGL